MLPVAIAEGAVDHGLGDLLRPRTAVLLTGLAPGRGAAMPAFLNYLLIRRSGGDQCVPRHVLLTRVCTLAGIDDFTRIRPLQRPSRGLILILCGSLTVTRQDKA